ncbi:MAG: hypothetical protein PVG39_27765 [Desulfobacteraceae bacterium]|jgi:chemotaxis regulatin CheY-phosphate phosphatase CheZ
MSNRNKPLSDVKNLLNSYDSNQQVEIAAQVFLEYCVYQNHCDTARRLAPLINTVAEALTKDLKNEDGLKQGIKAVQLYLQIPPAEYYGETLVRLTFLDRQSVDEMLQIKPDDIVFGTFLMEQGLITQEQRDIAVIAQKRLFTVQEIYARVVNPDQKEEEAQIIDSLKDIFQHFMISTAELEDDLNRSNIESIPSALQRLENIITETEKQTNAVLEIVDRFFGLEEEMRLNLQQIKENCDPSNNLISENIEIIMGKLDFINSLSLDLNGTQQIQDRIGQQLLKTIPTIQTFQNQITKIAQKLKLNWQTGEKDDGGMNGYECGEVDNRIEQYDVDDLLSNLGL